MFSHPSYVKRIGLGVVVFCIVIATIRVASAENKSVTLWSGIAGTGNTFGTPGECGLYGGTTRSYTSTSANVYYMQTYSKRYSTRDGVHLLNQDIKSAFNTYSTAQALVPWPDCYYNYQTTRHVWQSASGTSGIRKNAYTSATGFSSSAKCWNGSLC